MKYLVVLSDGMAGRPLDELGGKTTLEAADTPVMDSLSKYAEVGMAAMVPEGMAPGSDTANLAVMGYDPKIYYTGRSPLEALSIGVDMADTDVSFRCNIVTVSEEDCAYEDRTMIDHSSDEISTEDAAVLVEALKEGLKREGYEFYVGTSYRHLLVWKDGRTVELTPPHDILTKRIGDYLPEDEVLREMMKASYDILKNHPLNVERREKGLHPANSAWFWGAGTRPSLTSFEERTGKKGVMISAVDLLKGIAVGADMDRIIVEGANGGLHTNYEGKADAAVKALTQDGYDFAYIHVEAPDEMGHQGSIKDKIAAIEYVDEKVLGRVVKGLEKAGEDFRVLVLPDHPTPIEVRTHTGEPVPYLLYDSTCQKEGPSTYNEKTAKDTGNNWPDGYQLIGHLLQEDIC
ncbi:cofactor-independent phosphoglycerate mutase [Faecalicatena contorta]|uniref:cofactor-independent phosphoglycerate mutase n=1 Tax=Faecalicatena contorta TaxID=39482 RepID=UPI001F443B88|nr:cofactor-independent phosphoglycerate mutase [Faecalicatena contorta]MCF2680952.1 cofactor-independent phosphoglycerate mutase [Faecalicatena contorta]